MGPIHIPNDAFNCYLSMACLFWKKWYIIFSCCEKEMYYFGQTTLALQCKTSHIYSTFLNCDLFIVFKNISMQKKYNNFEIIIYSIFQLKNCKQIFRTIFFHHLRRLTPKGKWWYSMHHVHGCLTWFAKKKQWCFHIIIISVVVHVQLGQESAKDDNTSIHH